MYEKALSVCECGSESESERKRKIYKSVSLMHMYIITDGWKPDPQPSWSGKKNSMTPAHSILAITLTHVQCSHHLHTPFTDLHIHTHTVTLTLSLFHSHISTLSYSHTHTSNRNTHTHAHTRNTHTHTLSVTNI